ncbi:MAG: hypothetical protein JNL67_21325 [Planctomycetaceae bacterium]|nr:hypothetical protein [Planctomycetaceae bacterium]
MKTTLSNWDGSEGELMASERRPISVLSLISGISGALAGLAFFLPGLAVLSFVAIAAAIAAIATSRREPKALLWLSYLGVFLATLGTVWSVTTRSFYQNHMIAMGQKQAQDWLQMLVDDKLYEVICLRLDYWDRPLEGANLSEYFLKEERPAGLSESAPLPSQMKDSFLQSKTVQKFLTSGKNTELKLIPERTVFFEHAGWFEVESVFEVSFLLDDGQTGPRRKTETISVTIRRTQYPNSAHWQIRQLNNHTSPESPEAPMIAGEGQGEASDTDLKLNPLEDQ